MSAVLTLYTRRDCCLCAEMKRTIQQVTAGWPATLQEVDVDGSAELKEMYGHEVPVLLINGRKAFKYRVNSRELRRRLRREIGS